jgi:hypothetical protein
MAAKVRPAKTVVKTFAAKREALGELEMPSHKLKRYV